MSESAANDCPAPRSGSDRDWLRDFLVRRKLAEPGRPLYRYRMADDEYDQARTILHTMGADRLAQPDMHSGALFVAYCAEWFRRDSTSTSLRWDDPAPDLFPAIPDHAKRDLTTLGLDYWRRPLRTSAHGRRFLLTVALEGGFPVRILAEGAGGWLKDYLWAVMRRAGILGTDTMAAILGLAEEERWRMRKSYQHDDFIALCSELVASLLELRKKAEAETEGQALRNSALLDARYPGWRDELPIYVPLEDQDLVAGLLNGLLDNRMTGLVTEGVEARRYLVKRAGVWCPALQLVADGEVPPAKLPHAVTASGRLRAIATGELCNTIAGQFALFEPPFGDSQRWRVRPYARTSRLLSDFPFDAPVTVVLTATDGIPRPWIWPRGEALRSDVMVFEEDEGSTPAEPLLRYLRSGSVSSSRKTLHVLVPQDWTVEPQVPENAVAIEDIAVLGRKLVRLTSTTYFYNKDGERFRVEPDTDAREDELAIGASKSFGFELGDKRLELVAAPFVPEIREAGRVRPPREGELFVRRPGGKWQALTGPIDTVGVMELSWRDPVAGIQLERRQLALVPYQARIIGVMKDAQCGEISLEGLPGWTATIDKAAACTVEDLDDAVLSIRFTGRPVYRLPMRLQPPAGPAFDIIVPLVGRDAVIALSDGSIVSPGQRIDIRTLRGAVAVTPGRSTMNLAAKGTRTVAISVSFDGEFPLGILRGAISEMLATLPGQDDVLELDFIGSSTLPILVSHYRLHRLALFGGRVRWDAQSPGGSPVARMILDPRQEYALEVAADGLWQLPEVCKGTCLVYLRDGIDVVSRPIVVTQPGRPTMGSGDLIAALEVSEFKTRQHAVKAALERFGNGQAQEDDLQWLRNVVTSLNGLPAAAFDALKLLPSSAEALIHLLLNARDGEERNAIWALQNELPFLWLGLPLRAWWATMERNVTALSAMLESLLGIGNKAAGKEALQWLLGVGGELVAIEPAMAAIFQIAGLTIAGATVPPSLQDLTNGYIRDHFQRDEVSNDLARQLASAGVTLPLEITSKSHGEFAGLFAPVLLAASAAGKLKLDPRLALIARRALREDPVYVSGAWSQLAKFYE